LVTPERTRAVRELVELYEIVGSAELLDPVLNDLVSSRLLVLNTGGGGGGATVEIVHESLIEAWRTLRRWLEESHEDSMFLEQLRAAARQWEGKRRDSGLLWSGEMAEELARFRKRYRGELSEIVRAFADAVESYTQRRARLKKVLAFSGVAFLLVLLAAAGVALVIISQAQVNEEQARRAAEKNEKVARQAQQQAQSRLEAVQEKERARLAEANRRQEAEKQVARAETTIELTNEELAQANQHLRNALERAESQRLSAESARLAAQEKEREAIAAEERTRILLMREKERVRRLTEELGSPVVEKLR
jgi:hypothetical protein